MGAPLSHEVLLLRMAVALALGAVIGYERDRHRRPAGLRTHMLVSLAAALFMIVSSQFAFFQGYGKSSFDVVDGSRIASQVVAGAGLLVGGAILRSGFTVHGLTTAAGLWLVTAIGLTAGAGMFVEASGATGLGMFALWGLRTIEEKGNQRARGLVSLELDTQVTLDEVVQAIEQAGACIITHSYRRRYGTEPGVEVTVSIRHPETFSTDALVRGLERLPGIQTVRVQRTTE